MEDVVGPIMGPLVLLAIPIAAVVGAFGYLIVRTLAQARLRELEIRERIAMIERGLVPAPEVDPRGFERAIAGPAALARSRSALRHRRAGVTLMGVGLGLLVLIGATADVQIGLGVGGFIAILGLAFFINSLLEGSAPVLDSSMSPRPAAASAPPAAEHRTE